MANNQQELNVLKKEFRNLYQFLDRIREELAAIKVEEGDSDHFATMAEQLDAIVGATEKATTTILEAAEAIDEQARAIQKRHGDDGETKKAVADINGQVNEIFEACSFQDITGQRVSKVVGSLKYVDDRVRALYSAWGKDQLEKARRRLKKKRAECGNGNEDILLLNGPALGGQGVSQAEIDEMFN